PLSSAPALPLPTPDGVAATTPTIEPDAELPASAASVASGTKSPLLPPRDDGARALKRSRPKAAITDYFARSTAHQPAATARNAPHRAPATPPPSSLRGDSPPPPPSPRPNSPLAASAAPAAAVSDGDGPPAAKRARSQQQQPQPPPLRRLTQAVLDLGQRGAGMRACRECGMSYSRVGAEDAALHARHHAAVVNGVEFPEYAGEMVVARMLERGEEARVVLVTRDSSTALKNKTKESATKQQRKQVLDVVERELGAVPLPDEALDECQVFVYVSSRAVRGCVVAEPLRGPDGRRRVAVLRFVREEDATAAGEDGWVGGGNYDGDDVNEETGP
ncbi:N-acetyltransferase esco2, partial [Cladochytrium tenue]